MDPRETTYFAKAKFEEEIEERLMEKMSLERATHHLLERCPIDMLLYADDLESLATADSHRPQLLLPDGAGYPFKWSKTRGGYRDGIPLKRWRDWADSPLIGRGPS